MLRGSRATAEDFSRFATGVSVEGYVGEEASNGVGGLTVFMGGEGLNVPSAVLAVRCENVFLRSIEGIEGFEGIAEEGCLRRCQGGRGPRVGGLHARCHGR